MLARAAPQVVAPALATAGALVLWELAVRGLHVPIFLVPTPTAIVYSMATQMPFLTASTLATLQVIVYGYLVSVVVGGLIGLALVRFPAAYTSSYPLIVIFQTVPKVALAPILVIWFGYGLAPKILLVLAISFFPISLNLIAGLSAVDPNLIILMRSVGCSRTQTLMRVMLPSALPHLFAGLKVAVTLAVIGAIVAEFAGANKGLGYVIELASTQLDAPLVFAALTIVSVMGIACFYAVVIIERWTIPWAERAQMTQI